MSRKRRNEPRTIESWVTIVFFAAVFVGLIVYLLIYVKNNEQELISNSYNSRQKLLAAENTRGNILDRDGNIIATTVMAEDGKEHREYPMGNLYAHAVGFSTKGKTAVESMANYYLLNSDIPLSQKVQNDMDGKKNPGNDVHTTFDTRLEQIASDSLGVCKGAVVVSDVKTGEILAMVSKPDFDPNTVANYWDNYSNDSSSAVLLNRATQGLYPPGSTFKIITSLEYIREHNGDYSGYSYVCNGRFRSGDIDISCYHGSVHNEVSFRKSFAKSCNSSFANIGIGLDRDSFGRTLDGLLFNQNLPLDYNYSVSSFEMNNSISEDDLTQICIGQGKACITPIQLNMITNAIANKGTLMKPMVISHITNANGETVKEYKSEEYGNLMTEQEAIKLSELMQAVVDEGTGSKLKNEYYTAAGKTGSAEFNGNKLDSHAWFTGFAPVENPKISVTIIVENIGSGGEYAVPIAKRIFDAYMGVY